MTSHFTKQLLRCLLFAMAWLMVARRNIARTWVKIFTIASWSFWGSYKAVETPIWRYLYHEPVDFSIQEPKLVSVEGPLTTSNQAMPYLIFKRRLDWAERLAGVYDKPIETRPFSSLSYLVTGGISRKLPVPQFLYRSLFGADQPLARVAPDLFASFFTIVLVRSATPA